MISKIDRNILISDSRFKKQKEYWLTKLAGDLDELTLLPVNRMAEDLKTEPAQLEFIIPQSLAQKLMRLSKQNELTLFIVLLTGLKCLAYRYTGKEDIMIGAPVYLPTSTGETFNEYLVLRDVISGEMSFKDCLFKVRQTTIEAYENQDYPLDKTMEHPGVPKGQRYPFNIGCLFESIHDRQILEKAFSNLDLVLLFKKAQGAALPETLMVKLIFNPGVFEANDARQIYRSLIQLLSHALDEVNVKVADLQLLSKDEAERLIAFFNRTEAEYPGDQTVDQLWEARVRETPQKTAVIFENQKLSYRELDHRAAQLAKLLIENGIKPGVMAGIMAEPSPAMVVGIFGILKAGGAYLPIDPVSPPHRILTMLNDSGTSVLLTTEPASRKFSFTFLQRVSGNIVSPEISCPRPPILDLDRLPIPDRSLIDYDIYQKYIGQAMVKNTVSLQATRGCPYQCAYCHKIWSKTHVFRSAENIFGEMKLYYDMGVRRFVFIDDLFNLNQENSSKFLKMVIENNLEVRLFFPNGLRGDILTRDYIDLMVRAGTVNLSLALETASPRLQQLIGKNLNIAKFRDNLEYIIKKYPEVLIEVSFMHGFPTESEAEALTTLDFIKSMKWIHFPHFNILKIYPGSEMEKLAVAHGISREAIEKSADLAYHELPGTLPFSQSFTHKCQTDYLNEYFLNKERLLKVLPMQMSLMTESELVEKYQSYLPAAINSFDELLNLTGILRTELPASGFLTEKDTGVPDLNQKIRAYFPKKVPAANALKILLLDLSQYFSSEAANMLYDVVEAPLGLMYLLTSLFKKFGAEINGKIAKSRIDFNDYEELRLLIHDFKPDLIGIRTLTFYRDFFHKTTSLIRQWGCHAPIIAGGPYATSCYHELLKDGNINLAILGEGELTLSELVGKMIENNHIFPDEASLRSIPGIATVPRTQQSEGKIINRKIIFMDRLAESGTSDLTVLPGNGADPDQPAYLIYTSGTTGLPKGVIVKQRGLVNYVTWFIKEAGLTGNDKTILMSSFAFDLGYTSLYPALLSGAELHLAAKETYADPEMLLNYLRQNQITFIKITPSLFKILVNTPGFSLPHRCNALRLVVLGGEQIKVADVEKFYNQYPGVKIMNHYGPTETTIGTITHTINWERWTDYRKHPVIGKPIANAKVYILDQYLNPMPVGVVGAIHISGAGVAGGYLNKPELTAERFVANPFAPLLAGGSDLKMYRTGDLGRWLPGGEIEFWGRIDHQIKIRGYRLEPGEVERRFLEFPSVKEVIVTALDDAAGNKYLAAYFVAGKELTSHELRGFLSEELPEYMMPSYFIQLPQMPLTPNGKINRKALPEPKDQIRTGIGFQAPRNVQEIKLATIWQDVLKIVSVGIKDNFFELGGNSLNAVTLGARINKEFNVTIPLMEIFRTPNIEGISEYIKEAEINRYTAIQPVAEQEYYPVSSAQKRLYILDKFIGVGVSYNIAGTVIITGYLDKARVEKAFQSLVERHESFRTTFHLIDESPVQKIFKTVEFGISYFEAPEDQVDDIIKSFIRPFDLDKAPLLRVGLIKITNHENPNQYQHLLMYDMHHIISDRVSMEILTEEFFLLYEGKELPGLPLQYKDYAAWQTSLMSRESHADDWQNSGLNSSRMKEQERYWLNKLSGISQSEMPTDYPRPPIRSYEGDRVIFKAGKELTALIKLLMKNTGATLYMILLAAYNILLSKYSCREDIVIGAAISGRPHPDLEKIIGMFVNMLVMRNFPRQKMIFKDFLAEVKANSLEAFENQDFQFELLVEKLNLSGSSNRNPLFDFALDVSYLNLANLKNHDLEFSIYESHSIPIISKFDLLLSAAELEGEIRFNILYAVELFKKETIRVFAGHFINILEEVAGNSDLKLAEIQVLSKEEQEQLLGEYQASLAR